MDFENNNTIVNFSNSIIKHYGCKPFHNTIPEIDNLLKSHKKVCVLLFDGLGKYIRENHKKDCPLIYSHRVHTMQSTFPPTTVAATSGFGTAKFPIETGWLSWSQYFEEYKCNIDVFRNVKSGTKEVIRPKESLILFEKCPKELIFDIINKNNDKKTAFDCSLMGRNETKPWSRMIHRHKITKILRENEEAFVYYYLADPDHEIHVDGVNGKTVRKTIKSIEKFTKKLTKKNKDTLFLVIADHGLLDVDYIDIRKIPGFMETLRDEVPISMEVRNPTFFVKNDKKAEFEALFKEYLSEHFDLYTKEEVYEKHIFGDGIPHKEAEKFIGDYLAISKDEYCIWYDTNPDAFKCTARHAGGTPMEMEIDISVFNV